MPTLMAFDTSYLYYRAYFGVPKHFTAPTGHPVNAVRGLCDFLTKLITQYSPSLVACAWDEDWRPAWRVGLVASYKVHRLAADGAEEVEEDLARQVPWVRQALEAAGVPVLGVAQHEADDVLVSLARQHDGRTLVVSGDKDLFQMVDECTSVLHIGRSVAKHELLDPAAVLERTGVPASRYCDFAVLRGDPSDGLPGVNGVGVKTAASLVEQYPSLEAMLQAAQDPLVSMRPAVRAGLLEAAQRLGPTLQVVTAVDDLAIPELEAPSPDMEAVDQVTKRLGLGSSLRRLAEALIAVQQVER